MLQWLHGKQQQHIQLHSKLIIFHGFHNIHNLFTPCMLKSFNTINDSAIKGKKKTMQQIQRYFTLARPFALKATCLYVKYSVENIYQRLIT